MTVGTAAASMSRGVRRWPLSLTQVKAWPLDSGDSPAVMHIVSNIRVLALSGLVSALVLSAVATAARSEDDGWQADLRKQLAAEHECELNYLTDARTIELLGKQSISARAHCMDKRAFDVTRSGDETTFEVKSCSIVAC